MEIALIKTDKNLVFESQGKKVNFISLEKLEIQNIPRYEAIVFDAREKNVLEQIVEIRKSKDENVYLKPIFIYNPEDSKNPFLFELIDGEIDSRNISKIITYTENILKKISALIKFETKSFETEVSLKTLRFYFTRNRILQPIIIPTSKYGYVYPFISVQFPHNNDFRVFEILNFMESQGLWDGTFIDRIHLCGNCHSAFMNFREGCPKCRSAQLVQEDVIHHFMCAYTAPLREFKQAESLVCPKCNKMLRHIGIDYDKPSSVYICQSCGAVFQEPEVETFCLWCGNKMPVEDTEIRDVKSYTMTAAGSNCAIHGITFSISEFLRDKIKIVDYKFFTDIMSLEIERYKRYKRESSFGYLQIKNFPLVLIFSGERRGEILTEMAKIIKDTMRKTDLITAYNDSTFLFLLLETPVQNSVIALERVRERLEEFLSNNQLYTEQKTKPEISSKVLPVQEGASPASLFE